jgi:hypothetical protein
MKNQIKCEWDHVRFVERKQLDGRPMWDVVRVERSIKLGFLTKRFFQPSYFELTPNELRDILAFMDSLNQSTP